MGILGDERLQVLPIWELSFDDLPEESRKIATERLKWSLTYRKKHAIVSGPAREMPEKVAARIRSICRRVYRSLMLSGYARIDLRLQRGGRALRPRGQPEPAARRRRGFRRLRARGRPLLRDRGEAHPRPGPSLRAESALAGAGPARPGACRRAGCPARLRARPPPRPARLGLHEARQRFGLGLHLLARPGGERREGSHGHGRHRPSSSRASRSRPRSRPRARWRRCAGPTGRPAAGARRATKRSSARVATRLSYSGTKRTGRLRRRPSGRGASGRSKSSRPLSSRKVRSRGRSASKTSLSFGRPDQACTSVALRRAVGGEIPQDQVFRRRPPSRERRARAIRPPGRSATGPERTTAIRAPSGTITRGSDMRTA